ncbi:hypothetical protein [Paludisphaera borealis]|uniref:Uncharacterized protein n=1 Tax=Paludisphaera borealis TaxID=1387353 RepID=A0A1U7CR82_9BACT|nr:hypothetical protein [Paludisphaera borealis]APW61441.1 hypothetical protein BSF38_02955 [Paludisphaera borealis]
MLRSLARATLLSAVFAFMAGPAHAQYRYPGGYGGWGGWGGASTLQEGIGRGMGVYAAGAGAYNEQTAEARSMNANTAMQVNEYMYQVNQRNAKEFYGRSRANQKEQSATGVEIYNRIHDNPSTLDVHDGDALNAVLNDLTNPMVLGPAIKAATQQVDSQLVKNIEFEYAANMIAISLEDLSANGVPDVLLTSPDFKSEREAVRAVVATARKEASSQGQVSPETLAKARTAIKALKAKVDSVLPQGTKNRGEADNFLKALYGLTKMLQTPSVGPFLKGLDKYPTTTLGSVINFMHSFNLTFGAAKTPTQEAAYDHLFPMLVQLRNQVQAPASNPYSSQAVQPDPKKVTAYFSGMGFDHFGPQPDPHTGVAPPPPPPGQP